MKKARFWIFSLMALVLLLCAGSALAETCPTCGGTLSYDIVFGEDKHIKYCADGCTNVEEAHTFTGATYDWADDGSSCTAARQCSICLDREVIEATVTRDSTCTRNGYTLCTATFNKSWAETQEKSVYTGELEHDWSFTYDWAEDYSSVVFDAVCRNDATHTYHATITDIDHYVCAPISRNPGWVLDGLFRHQTVFMFDGHTNAPSVELPIHAWGDTTYEWAEDYSSCTAKRTCDANWCGASETAKATITTSTTEGDCTTGTVTTYTATFDNDWAKTQEKSVTAKGEHSYKATVTAPTCTEDGSTTYTCAQCGKSYVSDKTEKLLHWFGEWSPIGEHIHNATCLREGCGNAGEATCTLTDYHIIKAVSDDEIENTAFTFCPVCGEVSDGTRLTLIEDATADGETWFSGDIVLRTGTIGSGDVIMSIGFEYEGLLTQPVDTVTFTIPAALFEGYTPMLLGEDGTEEALPYTETDGVITFTFNYAPAEGEEATPLRVLHLIPNA